jgi:chromosome segregation ATPase
MGESVLSWQVVTPAAGLIVTVVGAVFGWTVRLLQSQTKHWKDLHDQKSTELEARTRELEKLRSEPGEAANDYIAAYKQTISEQILDMEGKISLLRKQLSEKDDQITKLKVETKEHEENLVFQVEYRTKLERTIDTYQEFIEKFMRESVFAEQVIDAFKTDAFDVSKVEHETERLRKQLLDIAATSYPLSRQSLRRNVDRAAAQKALAFQRALQEKIAAETRGRARAAVAVPLPRRDAGSRE